MNFQGEKLSFSYNSWPLGSLPKEWQRPEPFLIRDSGYEWSDPREINEIFETKLAVYSGAKYAVLTDCCTNGILLALMYRLVTGSLERGDELEIPSQTYVSVPMTLLHCGLVPKFVDLEWSGLYEIGNSGVWDSAARFTKGMFVGNGSLQVLSFQIKKRLPIGRGGAILTNDEEAYKWLKRAVYDGRDLKSKYTDASHVNQIGWHYYMTPEDAARGILILDQLPENNVDTMTSLSYPPITNYEFFGATS